jgi:DNA-binding transcriptional ArsR family regulator
MTEVQLFKALGDPLRLTLVKRLSDGTSYTMGDLTEGLGVTRQAARKQLQVLASAKVVQLKPNGREVMVVLNIESFKSGRDFITSLENKWDKRLMKLKNFVEKSKR